MTSTNSKLMQYDLAQQEQYTDLLLECRDTKFSVHRVIVYPQVPAIKAAYYFDVQPLRDLVHVKANEVLATPWSPAGFADVIDVAFQVNDETLHDLMVATVLDHLDDFIHPDGPSELFSDELCYRVLQSLKDDLRVAREKEQGLDLQLLTVSY
ncbi:hypothetical protein BO82DRAFT_399508 [Aspergillus uvarum CBS 121591]|uniref:BTB domain-containing protein n=1 Tax=Aspergillus uvarum CBS 121591 TaxID=1448315 RepID=A0A319CJP0_9EURO|nr:hypothetical protein BO82DRAFT_399508 [Aspergillus uvarum CBS 121591]PYH84680.1 hypothetical protein BO82DRAFT_399508 [Aspergillus uvarum CBS 121591]